MRRDRGKEQHELRESNPRFSSFFSPKLPFWDPPSLFPQTLMKKGVFEF